MALYFSIYFLDWIWIWKTWITLLACGKGSLAYAKNFHGGFSLSGIWLLFVFGVRYFWRHNLTSYSSFQTKVLAKFVDTSHTMWIFFHTHYPYFMCYCTEYKLSALQVTISEENTFNATRQQFITAKISGWALKQATKTHWSLRQSIYNNNFYIKSTN